MTLLFKELKNAKSLNLALRDSSSNDIDEIICKLQVIQDKIKEREALEQARNENKKAVIAEILARMKEYDITIDDLCAAGGFTAHGRRGKMKKRYRFIGTDGVEYFWSGQGRLPKELVLVMQRDGTSKQDYLIKDEEEQEEPAAQPYEAENPAE